MTLRELFKRTPFCKALGVTNRTVMVMMFLSHPVFTYSEKELVELTDMTVEDASEAVDVLLRNGFLKEKDGMYQANTQGIVYQSINDLNRELVKNEVSKK